MCLLKRAAQKSWMHAYLESKFNIPKQLLMGGWGGGGWMDNSKDLLNAVEALLYGSTIYNNKLEPISLSLSLSLSHTHTHTECLPEQKHSRDVRQVYNASLSLLSQGGFPQVFQQYILSILPSPYQCFQCTTSCIYPFSFCFCLILFFWSNAVESLLLKVMIYCGLPK